MTHYLDRRFRRVGRIKRAAGSDDRSTIKNLDGMLTVLYAQGRLDILTGIKEGTYTPLQVWDAFRLGELERLPTAKTIVPLGASMKQWIDAKRCSEYHRLSLRQSLRYIERASKNATVQDLPGIVQKLSTSLPPRSFNLLRSAAQAFLRSTLKRSHPLYIAVTDIEAHKVVTARSAHPLTLEQMKQLSQKLGLRHRNSAWAMALTGMGPGEYWGKWNIEADRIHVHGTKRAGRDRFVPLVKRIATPYATKKAFAEALKHVEGMIVTPYDFRRTYANWMEAAGIPRTRRRLYMGHGKRDVTDLYERHEVAAFLVEDAEKLRAFVGATEPSGLRIHA